MFKNLMLSSLLSSAILSSVPLSAQSIDSFQNLYNLGSYDVWLDVKDTDFYYSMYENDYTMGCGDILMTYHIVYDLYSNTQTSLEAGYDNFYVKLYTLTVDFNPFVVVNADGFEYNNNLIDNYYDASWNYARGINYYDYLNYDGERMSNTLFSYQDLQFYTTLRFNFGNGSSYTLFECYNSNTNYENYFRHRIMYPNDYYNDSEKFYYHRSYYTGGSYVFEKDITSSTSLVDNWYTILDTNIASAEKITDSYNDGYSTGFSFGYGNGFNDGQSVDQTVTTIFNGIFGIALLPINMFLNIFNFEVMGINISGIVTALLTVAVIVIVVKFVSGKNVSGGE